MEKQSPLYSILPETLGLLEQFRAKHKIVLSVLPSSPLEKEKEKVSTLHFCKDEQKALQMDVETSA